MTGWLLILMGVVLTLAALAVEIRHKSIWANSLARYKSPASQLMDWLRRPNLLSYRLNLYLIWPLVFAIGLVCIYLGYDELSRNLG